MDQDIHISIEGVHAEFFHRLLGYLLEINESHDKSYSHARHSVNNIFSSPKGQSPKIFRASVQAFLSPLPITDNHFRNHVLAFFDETAKQYTDMLRIESDAAINFYADMCKIYSAYGIPAINADMLNNMPLVTLSLLELMVNRPNGSNRIVNATFQAIDEYKAAINALILLKGQASKKTVNLPSREDDLKRLDEAEKAVLAIMAKFTREQNLAASAHKRNGQPLDYLSLPPNIGFFTFSQKALDAAKAAAEKLSQEYIAAQKQYAQVHAEVETNRPIREAAKKVTDALKQALDTAKECELAVTPFARYTSDEDAMTARIATRSAKVSEDFKHAFNAHVKGEQIEITGKVAVSTYNLISELLRQSEEFRTSGIQVNEYTWFRKSFPEFQPNKIVLHNNSVLRLSAFALDGYMHGRSLPEFFQKKVIETLEVAAGKHEDKTILFGNDAVAALKEIAVKLSPRTPDITSPLCLSLIVKRDIVLTRGAIALLTHNYSGEAKYELPVLEEIDAIFTQAVESAKTRGVQPASARCAAA